MNDGGATALEQALGLHKAPRRAASMRRQPLPPGIEQLLRIAAGDREAIAQATAASEEPEAVVREAATFYVQQVLFEPDADSYRVLGLNPDASDAQLKANHRWLVHWLHPDRNRDSWEAVFVDRVNVAWNDLRNPARRSSYALRTPSFAAAARREDPALAKMPAAAMAAPVDDVPRLSSGTVRRAPAIVIGLLALMSVSTVGLLWQAQRDADAGARAIATRTVPVAAPVPVDAPRPVDASPRGVPAPAAASRATSAAVAPVRATATGPSRESARSSSPSPTPAPTLAPTPLAAAPARRVRAMPATVAAAVPADATAPAMRDEIGPAQSTSVTVAADTRVEAVGAPSAAIATPAVATPMPTAVPPPVATSNAGPGRPVLVLHDPYATSGAVLDPISAHALVQRYTERYERGDLPGLRSLFTADPDRDLRRALRDVERVIVRSDYRRIELHDHELRPLGQGARLVGSYVATVVAVGAPQGTLSRGVLVLDMRLEAGQPRITGLHMEPDDE